MKFAGKSNKTHYIQRTLVTVGSRIFRLSFPLLRYKYSNKQIYTFACCFICVSRLAPHNEGRRWLRVSEITGYLEIYLRLE